MQPLIVIQCSAAKCQPINRRMESASVKPMTVEIETETWFHCNEATLTALPRASEMMTGDGSIQSTWNTEHDRLQRGCRTEAMERLKSYNVATFHKMAPIQTAPLMAVDWINLNRINQKPTTIELLADQKKKTRAKG